MRRWFRRAEPVAEPAPRVERWDHDRVVSEMQAWAAELGRPLHARDARASGARVNAQTAARYFGSWSNALVAAGLPVPSRGRVRDRISEEAIAAAFSEADSTAGAAEVLGCAEKTLRNRMTLLGLKPRRVTRLFRDGVEVSADALSPIRANWRGLAAHRITTRVQGPNPASSATLTRARSGVAQHQRPLGDRRGDSGEDD